MIFFVTFVIFSVLFLRNITIKQEIRGCPLCLSQTVSSFNKHSLYQTHLQLRDKRSVTSCVLSRMCLLCFITSNATE